MSDKACARTELLIGREGMINLASRHVLVAGLGGVGGHAAETLARAGVGTLTLVDNDRVAPSNLNRQLLALNSTLGLSKVQVMAERIRDINPELDVRVLDQFIDQENAAALLEGEPLDYVADCIDTVACKTALIAAALDRSIPVISSMGAAGRLDARRVQCVKLNQTHGDGLARAVRKRLKQAGYALDLPVIFSDEPPALGIPKSMTDEGEKAHPRSVNGTIAHMPPLFGLMLAGEIIRRLLLAG
ncbi:MAG: tRNA threonylcarbamoyladenosine dehydratase [Gammaproteobacteria bacterium]